MSKSAKQYLVALFLIHSSCVYGQNYFYRNGHINFAIYTPISYSELLSDHSDVHFLEIDQPRPTNTKLFRINDSISLFREIDTLVIKTVKNLSLPPSLSKLRKLKQVIIAGKLTKDCNLNFEGSAKSLENLRIINNGKEFLFPYLDSSFTKLETIDIYFSSTHIEENTMIDFIKMTKKLNLFRVSIHLKQISEERKARINSRFQSIGLNFKVI